MTIRILTSADLDVMLPIIQAARPGLFDRTQALGLFSSPNPFVVWGDPSVPALGRLEHYRLPANHPIRPGVLATQVTDLYGGGGVTISQLVPLLAEVLARMVIAFPAASARPVWAHLPNDRALLMAAAFPHATRTASAPGYSYIHATRLSDAAADVAALRP